MEEQQVVMWPGQGARKPIPGSAGLEFRPRGEIGRPVSRVRPDTKGVLATSCLQPRSERGQPAPSILGDDRTTAIVDDQLGKLHRCRARHCCKPAQKRKEPVPEAPRQRIVQCDALPRLKSCSFLGYACLSPTTLAPKGSVPAQRGDCSPPVVSLFLVVDVLRGSLPPSTGNTKFPKSRIG